MNQPVKAIVLAAGKGTRLQSEASQLPKVMRQAMGRPLLDYVLEGLGFLPKEDIILVVGYRKEDVLAAYPGYPFAEQTEQLGTGHAVQCAMPLLEGFSGHVMVCNGDMPLMKRTSYEELLKSHIEQNNDCTLLSGRGDGPLPYGRVIRNAGGGFLRVIEDKDCSPAEKAITELNAGDYVFRAEPLREALASLKPDNAQGEYYITDAPAYILAHGGRVEANTVCTVEEMVGVNTLEELAHVESILSAR